MLCQNCGENEANIKYTQIINGVRKEMTLCNKCAKELGVEDIHFNMPIHFSNFLEDMFEGDSLFNSSLLSSKTSICKTCQMKYDNFFENGFLGCEDCYDLFQNRIDPILKNIHGANRHVGRVGKMVGNKEIQNEKPKEKEKQKSELDTLKERLKQEIKEEKYEDEAKTRDEIKKLEGGL